MSNLAVLLLALACGCALAGDDPWRLEKDQDGVQMYTRAVEGWSIREIRGVERVEAPLSSVVALLVDTDASHALSDVVVDEKVVQRTDDTHYRFYSQMDLPWPVSDRDAVYARDIVQDDRTLAVTITDVALDGDDGIELRKGVVRMVKSKQTWTLTPAPNGVDVELRVLADPNGPIPSAIINAMSVGTPFKMLLKLREMVRGPAYAGAKISFIREAPK